MSAEALKVIGQDVNRVEGRAKVTGRANFAADNPEPGLVHAVGVFSEIGAGKVASIDTKDAEQAPGTLAVLHRGNSGKLYRSPNEMEQNTRVSEARPPFEDDGVYYAGQFVALVIAETFEQARWAARQVKVVYTGEKKPTVSLESDERVHGVRETDEHPDYARGDAERAWAEAAVRIEATYRTPAEVHNPMEPHATTARWNGERLFIHDSTQWVVGQQQALAKVLGIAKENVTVSAPFVGGGFGGKLFLWPHTILAAAAARQVGRPVKLVVDRHQMFTTVGHRPATRQRLKLAADATGKLVALRHDTVAETSLVDDFLESSGGTSGALYRCGNVAVTHRLTSGNVGTPCPMRAPGAASGLIALEGAMDELAEAAGVDPIEFRLRNIAERDEQKNRPWSGNRARECCELVRERFGWARRNSKPGAMREGDEAIGWGFALASWGAEREEAEARAEFRTDGTLRVMCATQDIGTGTYTVIAQAAAEVAGLPVEKVAVEIGRSDFPAGPISGGSMATATVMPAVIEATKRAMDEVLKVATKEGGVFAGAKKETLEFRAGNIGAKKGGKKATVEEVIGAARVASVGGQAKAKPGEERKKYSFRAFGAHAVEVRWDPGIGRLRVARIVSAFDVGRVINRKTASNQIYGALLMGVGMALLEEAIYDPRNGRVVNDNLADYLVPVHADTPEMDITFLDQPDEHMGGFGARGVGEIGITGIGGAIANAVYHATGRRGREMPIRMEHLMG